jgi:uncharacterized membrane protein
MPAVVQEFSLGCSTGEARMLRSSTRSKTQLFSKDSLEAQRSALPAKTRSSSRKVLCVFMFFFVLLFGVGATVGIVFGLSVYATPFQYLCPSPLAAIASASGCFIRDARSVITCSVRMAGGSVSDFSGNMRSGIVDKFAT